MLKHTFLFTVSLFLTLFAESQSQMIKGTIVPVNKKPILILPKADKGDTLSIINNATTKPIAIPLKKQIPSPLFALDTTVLKNYDSTIIPVKTKLKAQFITGELLPTPGISTEIRPLNEDSLRMAKMKSNDTATSSSIAQNILNSKLSNSSINKVQDQNAQNEKSQNNKEQVVKAKGLVKSKGTDIPNNMDQTVKDQNGTGLILEKNGYKNQEKIQKSNANNDPLSSYSLPTQTGTKRLESALAEKNQESVVNEKNGQGRNSDQITYKDQGSLQKLSTNDDPINSYSLPPNFSNTKGASSHEKTVNFSKDPINNYSLPPGSTAVSVPELVRREIKSPLDAIDTTVTKLDSDIISKYSLPPEIQPKLKAQNLKGIIQAKPGVSTLLEPLAIPDSVNKNSNPLFPPQKDTIPVPENDPDIKKKPITFKSPLDVLDTTQMVYDASSMISSYTVLNQASFKSQMIEKGALVPGKGVPIIVEPLSEDSILRKQADTVKLETPEENIDSITDINPINTKKLSLRSNFYVAQTGKFSLRFSTDLFYLNITQLGELIDYELLSNGKVRSNAKNKVVQIGNVKVGYNLDGSIASLAGVPITYTYDGKVNRVGDISISYSYEGAINKVGSVAVQYNNNNTVAKIADYKVGYNTKNFVIGIDDSNGLVIFKQ